MIKVRVETMHGLVEYEAEFSETEVMDAQKVIDKYLDDNTEMTANEVEWHEECNGLYDYRVVFLDIDEEGDFTILSSTGFNVNE